MTGTEDCWEILEKIGDYAAGELSGEEARQIERMILESPEGRRLAESYVRLLDLLEAISQKSPEPPQAIIERAIQWAGDEGRK